MKKKIKLPKLSPRTVKVLAFGVPILLVAIVVIYVIIHSSNRWEDTEIRFKKRLEEMEAETWERPVLHGDRMGGEAWEHYEGILGSVPSELPDTRDFDDVLSGRLEDLAIVRAVVSQHLKVPDALRKGARSRIGGRPMDWREGHSSGESSVASAQSIARIGSAHGVLLMEEGSKGEAVRVVLDTMQFSMDLCRGGDIDRFSMSQACLRHPMAVLANWLERDLMGSSELALLKQALEEFDSAWVSHADILRNQWLLLDADIMKEDVGGIGGITRRLRLASVSDVYERVFGRYLEAAAEKPWPKLRGRLKSLRRWAKVEEGDSTLADELRVAEAETDRLLHGQLAVLRAATVLRVAGELPSVVPDGWPLDPCFNAGVGYRRMLNAKIGVVWSAGPDGADDGGTGDWGCGDGTEDIVLELERP